MGACKFYCHSRVLNKMLMLRGVTFDCGPAVILNKRRDMLVEQLLMGSSGSIWSHHLGCNFGYSKVHTFELDLLISIV